MASRISQEERQMTMFTHLAALAVFIFPFGNIIGPLVRWLIRKNSMPFQDDQGKEALNFNIPFSIAGIVCLILFLVVIGYFLLIDLSVVWFVFMIIATIRASEGEAYRYPLSVRFIKYAGRIQERQPAGAAFPFDSKMGLSLYSCPPCNPRPP